MGSRIILCIDCEGTRTQIERIHAALARRRIAANFFFVGQTALAYPDLVRDIARDYQCESHTMTHCRLRGVALEEQRREIAGGRAAVESVIGRRTYGFRAPCHSLDRNTIRILNEEGFTFDVSTLYFRYSDLGRVRALRPSWFREWMPLYGKIGIRPSLAFGVFRHFARRPALAVLPIHPHYSALNDALYRAYEDFLDYALSRGARFQTINEYLDGNTPGC